MATECGNGWRNRGVSRPRVAELPSSGGDRETRVVVANDPCSFAVPAVVYG